MLGEDLGKQFRAFANAGNVNALKKLYSVAIVNSKGTASQRTALHFAANQGHVAAVDFLLSKSALADEFDSAQNNPLMLALEAGHKAVAELLLPKTKLICTNRSGLNVLQIAKQHPAFKNDAQFINRIKSLVYQQAADHYEDYGEVHITKSGIIKTHVELEQSLTNLSLGEEIKETAADLSPLHPFKPANLPFTAFVFKQPKPLKSQLAADVKQAENLFSSLEPIPVFGGPAKLFELLSMQIDKYFESKDPTSPMTPEDRVQVSQIWEQTLSFFSAFLTKGKNKAIIESDKDKACFYSKLFLFRTIALYDQLVDILKQNPNPDAAQQKEIKALFSQIDVSSRYSHFYAETQDLQVPYILLRKEIIVLVNRLQAVFNRLWLSLEELQYHIDRKNDESSKDHSDYHAKLIYNKEPTSVSEVDIYCVETLFNEVVKIQRGEAKRTQFILDVVGQSHALTLDISWDPQTLQLEIMCVESSVLVTQYNLIVELSSRLTMQNIKHQILAIQANVQKDMSSCYTIAYMFSRLLSKLTFEQLNNHKSVTQPTFSVGGNLQRLPPLHDNVKWLDVSALGERAVKMGQSYTDMRKNLLKIYPKQEEAVDKKIAQWKSWYEVELNDPSKEESANLTAYTTYRRQSLRLKAMGTPLNGISVEQIYAHTKATTEGQALRRLAAGWGPLREMRYLLKAHPEVMNEVSEKDSKTPLGWAIDKKQHHRAKILRDAGAK